MKLKTLDKKKLTGYISLDAYSMECEFENDNLVAVTINTRKGKVIIKKTESYSSTLSLLVPDLSEGDRWDVTGEVNGIPFIFEFESEDKAIEKKNRLLELNSRTEAFEIKIEKWNSYNGRMVGANVASSALGPVATAASDLPF